MCFGYTYLGNWKDRENNRNIEREFVEGWLASQGHDDNLIAKVRCLSLRKRRRWAGARPFTTSTMMSTRYSGTGSRSNPTLVRTT